MDWILKHKITSIIIVVVLAVAAWYFLSGSAAPSTPVLSPTAASTGAVPAGAQALVNSLLALKAVSLNGSIFSDPSYQALQDFTTPVEPEPAGRNDPFAPIGAAQSTTATTKGAQINFAPKN